MRPASKLVVLGVLAGVALLVASCGGTKTVTVTVGAKKARPTPKRVRVVDPDNWGCFKDELDSAGRCPHNPDFGKTRAQVHAEAVAKAKALRKKKIAAAKAAAAQRARIAAENAWHKGYVQQDDNVYWRWDNTGSCQEFAQNGCWHVEVITRDGCPSYVAVHANEYSNGAIVNELLDNQGYGIPPKTPRVFELDADASSDSANNVSVDCE